MHHVGRRLRLATVAGVTVAVAPAGVAGERAGAGGAHPPRDVILRARACAPAGPTVLQIGHQVEVLVDASIAIVVHVVADLGHAALDRGVVRGRGVDAGVAARLTLELAGVDVDRPATPARAGRPRTAAHPHARPVELHGQPERHALLKADAEVAGHDLRFLHQPHHPHVHRSEGAAFVGEGERAGQGLRSELGVGALRLAHRPPRVDPDAVDHRDHGVVRADGDDDLRDLGGAGREERAREEHRGRAERAQRISRTPGMKSPWVGLVTSSMMK